MSRIEQRFGRITKPENSIDRQAVAARARAIIMEVERGLGFEPTDRELEKLGYDVESKNPEKGTRCNQRQLQFSSAIGPSGAAAMTSPNTGSEEVSNHDRQLPVLAELRAIDPQSYGNVYEEPGETSYSLTAYIFDGLRDLRHHGHKHGLPTV